MLIAALMPFLHMGPAQGKTREKLFEEKKKEKRKKFKKTLSVLPPLSFSHKFISLLATISVCVVPDMPQGLQTTLITADVQQILPFSSNQET